MKNRVVVLQPSYIPWLGYFDQINKADIFVFYDDVLYTKNDWRNRNKIKTPQGTQWLTIPVDTKNRLTNKLLIKNTRITDESVLTKHLKIIELNYKRAPYFKKIFPFIENVLNNKYKYLSDLDIDIIIFISKLLGIEKTKFVKSSNIKVLSNNPTDHLIAICNHFKATHYLTGESAKNYLNEAMFKKSGVILEYQNYKHPRYKQLWGEFIPYLSIIDLIFNEGSNSLKILSNK